MTSPCAKAGAATTGDYHGNFDPVLVRSVGKGARRRTLPLAPGIPESAVGDVIVVPWGKPEALDMIREIAHELAAGHAGRLALIIKAIAPHLMLVSVNGADPSGGWEQVIRPLDEGSLDVAAVLRHLDAAGYRHLHLESAPGEDGFALAINDRLRRAAAR